MAIGHPQEPEVFVSYSHKDQRWLDELLVHLSPLEKEGLLDCWSDQEIGPGRLWEEEISRALRSCKVAVLLVTRDFLASPFIADKELPTLLAAERGLTILWIPCSASTYKHTALAKYEAGHPPDRPLDTLSRPERQEALVKICDRILEAAKSPARAAGGTGRARRDRATIEAARATREDAAPHPPTILLAEQSALEDFPILRRSRLIWTVLAVLLGIFLILCPLSLPLPETPIAKQIPFLSWRQVGWAGVGVALLLFCAIRYLRETFVNKAADQLTDLVLLVASGLLDVATHWRQSSRRWAVGLVVAAIMIFPVALLAFGRLRSQLDSIGDISDLREKLLVFACYGRLQGGNEADLRVLVKSYFLPERLSTPALRSSYRTIEDLYALQMEALNDSLEIRGRKVLEFWQRVVQQPLDASMDSTNGEASDVEDRLILLTLRCRARIFLLSQNITSEQSLDELRKAEEEHSRLRDLALTVGSDAARQKPLGVARNGLGTLQALGYRLIMSKTGANAARSKATLLNRADDLYQESTDLAASGDQSDEAKHRRDNNEADLDIYLLHESLAGDETFVANLNASLLARYRTFRDAGWNASEWVNAHAALQEKARFSRNPIFFFTMAQLNALAAEKVLRDNPSCNQELRDTSLPASPPCSAMAQMLRTGFLNLATAVNLGQLANGIARDPETNFLCIYFLNPLTAGDASFLFTRLQAPPDLKQCS